MKEILKPRPQPTLIVRLAAAFILISVSSIAALSQTSNPTPTDKRGLGIETGTPNQTQADQTKSKEAKPELVLQTGYNNFFGPTRLVFSPDDRLLATATFQQHDQIVGDSDG